MNNQRSSHLRYRPALDGLRGIAVLGVLIYHLWPAALPGGWLGVDLFFVLSGFLITSLLVREYAATGEIDLLSFWTARMRRLLPALLVMLLAVALMMALWTVPVRRASVGLDIITTLGYVANWHLLMTHEAYFAAMGTPSPVRHTWSLGIEEQFYILFPVLLLVLGRLVRRRSALALILLGLAILSAGWMAFLFHPGVDPTRVYYGTDTRAFELLIGAAAGAWVGPRLWSRRRASTWMLRLQRCAWPALLGIVLGFLTVHEDMSWVFQGGLVAFCCCALVLILTAASSHHSSFQRALSWEPLRRLGLISYSLYLWHWPLHTFLTPDRLHVPSGPALAIQALLSCGLAAATYRYIERPIRTRGMTGLVPRLPTAGPIMASVTTAAVVAAGLGLPHVAPLLPNTLESAAAGPDLTVPLRTYHPAKRQKVVLVGNSIPASLAQTFNGYAYSDLSMSDQASLGCTAYDNSGELSQGRPVEIAPSCASFQRNWASALNGQDTLVYFVPQNLLHDQRVDGRTLRAQSPAHDAWVQSTFATVKQQADAHHVPHVAFVTFACHRMPTFGQSHGEAALINNDKAVQHLNELVRHWSGAHQVALIDQYSFLCPHNVYYGRVNGTPLYADALHFTPQSGVIVWSWFADEIQKAAAK